MSKTENPEARHLRTALTQILYAAHSHGDDLGCYIIPIAKRALRVTSMWTGFYQDCPNPPTENGQREG